jgi:hypothetical protein
MPVSWQEPVCQSLCASERAGSHPKARCAVQSVASVFVFTEKPWQKMWKKQGAPHRRSFRSANKCTRTQANFLWTSASSERGT